MIKNNFERILTNVQAEEKKESVMRSLDLAQRCIRYPNVEEGTYDVYIKDAYVDPRNSERVRIDLAFNEKEIFETYFRPSNMVWDMGWDQYLTENNLQNISELPGRYVQIKVENNVTGNAVFSNIVSIISIEPRPKYDNAAEPKKVKE